MQVQDLIDTLNQFDGEQEIRLAFQPNWPLAFEIGRVVSTDEFEAEIDEDSFEGFHARCDGYDFSNYCDACDERDNQPDHDTRHLDGPDDDLPIVWITEGGHPSDSPYAPMGAFETF